MRGNLLALALGAVAVSASPIEEHSSISSCAAAMDGSLPPTPAGFNYSGNVRRYYIAAEVETWDYAPTGWDNWLGVPMNESFRAWQWGYIATNESMGTVYDKGLYRGYTGSDFKTRSEQPPWQGYMGPTIRGEVGDMIEILFVNKMDTYYANMHSMGLYYDKNNEGSLYWNGSAPAPGDAVPPGGCVVYKWLIPETSAPGPAFPSKLWSYHGFISMYSDQDAGLSGPAIVYQRGQMNSTMASNRELIVGMFDNQESNSWLAEHNVNKYLPSQASKATNKASTDYPKITNKGNESIWYPQMVNTPWTPGLTSSILPNFFPINGYIYSNNPLFEMCVGDDVIWYLWNMGFDEHVFHLHAHNFYINNILKGASHISPGEMQNLHTPDIQDPGLWQMVCHENTHFGKGMEANFMVYESGSACPLPALNKS